MIMEKKRTDTMRERERKERKGKWKMELLES